MSTAPRPVPTFGDPTLGSRLALPYEDVADEFDVTVPGSRDVTDPRAAADGVVDYLTRRVRALADAHPGRLGLMLSGGIDSILLAAVARAEGLDPLTVTVVADDHSPDLAPASDAARHLGLDHVVRTMPSRDVVSSAHACAIALGCDDVWEVMAAVPIRAAFEEFARTGVTGPVLTGTGADVIFAGGKHLQAPVWTREAEVELDALTMRSVATAFRRDRAIPDFYERVLGDEAGRFVKAFQTTEAWLISRTLSASVLWADATDGRRHDKFALRLAALELGVPADLVWTTKSPLQRSSGLVDALGAALRAALANRPGATTHTDPRTEDVDLLLARAAVAFAPSVLTDLP